MIGILAGMGPKSTGPFIDQVVKNSIGPLEVLTKALLQEGVDTIVLACTDLNVVFKEAETPFQLVVSSTCLAQSIVTAWVDFRARNSKKFSE
jgi:aspartate/glutamate racemase